MSQQDQLGVRALKLLAEEWTVAVLRGLAGGALRPIELERALPDAGHAVLVLRLRHLLDGGLLTCEHRPGVPPQARSVGVPHEARYSLTDAGRMLLEVTAEAGRWEEIWCSQLERRGRAGVLAVRLLADRYTREIMLLLADGALSPADLGGRVCGLGRSALRRRLGELVLGGLLRRGRGRVLRYELTAGGRRPAVTCTTCCACSRRSLRSPSRWRASAGCTWTRAARMTPISIWRHKRAVFSPPRVPPRRQRRRSATRPPRRGVTRCSTGRGRSRSAATRRCWRPSSRR